MNNHKIRFTLLTFIFLFLSVTASPQNVTNIMKKYFKEYQRTDIKLKPSKVKSCLTNSKKKRITITVEGGFQEQFFTSPVVEQIYDSVRSALPKKLRDYKITIITDGHPIEELVPNFFRTSKIDESRLWKNEYKGKPWTKNISRPYSATEGLEGTHISLWQSHGRIFREKKNEWVWQRPNLFCTTEDLFTQTLVVPYIIPMLENAGAVVFTPRERDWQNNEVIIDNDTPNKNGIYIEGANRKKKSIDTWHTTSQYGFSHIKDVYLPCDSPFTYGTARYIPTVKSEKEESFAQWIPDIPEEGKYAVYVSYQSLPESVDDARYIIFHKGGMTEFEVNQRIGGGTWVYLGTFEFDKGTNDYGMVVLSNRNEKDGIITADAVRFGGGMGNVARGLTDSIATISGLPRWAEGAIYSSLWYGLPYSVHSERFGTDDYSNDINSRSQTINHLSGGSVYNPQQEGRGVPFEVALAVHSDAGYTENDEFKGSLAIYQTEFNEGVTGAGLNRFVSRDLSSMLLTNLQYDLSKYNWNVRTLWNKNYGEAREPMIPVCILETLSHQNFSDLKLGYDPQFKFDFCRSLYKTLVKFVATEHKRDYTIQPLPVKDFYITLNEKKKTAHLHWTPVEDRLEPTAKPDEYIVYTRKGYESFDNGKIVKDNACEIELVPNVVYSFKVAAVNKGGVSFPSETLSAYLSSENDGTILIVNAFTRLEGPASINTDTEQGFDLALDPGVQYGAFAGFCGNQIGFDKKRIGIENETGLGYSGSEHEGQIIMGNTFDYVAEHGKAIAQMQNHSYTSTSEGALLNGNVSLKDFKMVDIIYGVQRIFDYRTFSMIEDYTRNGGRVFVSGSNIFKKENYGVNSPLEINNVFLNTTYTTQLIDKSINRISGCGLNFNIYRELNPKCYSVPLPEVLKAEGSAFPMLVYSDGSPAGVAYDGNDYKSIVMGFPLETITDKNIQNRLMSAIITFLCK